MSEQDKVKRLNSFQLVGQILAAMVGIRSRRDRGTDFTNSSNSAWMGAILIFAFALYFGMRLFVYLIQRNVAG
ncbi:MAG: DUF2970 domain-containing protein [Pseudomonadota bacterium]